MERAAPRWTLVRPVLLIVLLGIVAAVPEAAAHAVPVRSYPAPEGRLAHGPNEVWIEFSEGLDPAGSRLRLFNETSANVATEEAAVSHRTRLSVSMTDPLPEGGYVGQWDVLSRVDGHRTRGAWAFAVGNGAVPEAAAAETPPIRWDSVLGKFASFAGLALLAGAIAFHRWILPASARKNPHPALRRVALAGAALQVVGVLMFLHAQADSTGRSMVGYATETEFGQGIALRFALAALFVPVLALHRIERSPWGASVEAILASLAVAAYGAYSHTTAVTDPYWWGALLDSAHLGAALVWSGALVCLMTYLRTAPTADPLEAEQVSRRFSRLAGTSIVAIAATGILMVGAILGWRPVSWVDALATDYGVVLLFKVLLALAMMAIGAVNRYVHVPRTRGNAEEARNEFRLNVRREVAVGFLVIFLAALVTSLSPTFVAPAGASETLTIGARGHQHDFEAVLDPAPRPQEVTRVLITVTETDTGEPLREFFRVVLTVEPLDSDYGPMEVVTEPLGNGTFAAEGAYFPFVGTYRCVILAQLPGGEEDSVELEVRVA